MVLATRRALARLLKRRRFECDSTRASTKKSSPPKRDATPSRNVGVCHGRLDVEALLARHALRLFEDDDRVRREDDDAAVGRALGDLTTAAPQAAWPSPASRHRRRP